MANENDDLGLDSTKEEARVLLNFENRVRTDVKSAYLDKVDYSYFGVPLCSLKDALPVKVHYTEKGPRLCLKSQVLTDDASKVECKGCKEPNPFNKKKLNTAANCLLVPFYMFDAVGNVITWETEDGEEKSVNDNPEQIVILKRGQNDVNLDKMRQYDDQGEFQNFVWELKRYPQRT
jgi:hypothetical protein